MPQTIFYSWQSDRSTTTGRNLIERALKDAIEELVSHPELQEADRPELDRDTKDVCGSPIVAETIFSKIETASAFVADLTFVAARPDGRLSPNPNVLIEYGWAAKALTRSRIVAAMNTAYGDPATEPLPFDLQHLRRPITYRCPEDASETERQTQRKSLAKEFVNALRPIVALKKDEHNGGPVEFRAIEPTWGRSRFRTSAEALGQLGGDLPFESPKPVYLESGPAMWLRLMPTTPLREKIKHSDLRRSLIQSGRAFHPLNWHDQGDIYSIRGSDGCGICAYVTENRAPAVFYAFDTGEVWSVDTSHFAQGGQVIFSEDQFVAALRDYAEFLQSVGIGGPYRWVAGLEYVRGLVFRPPGDRWQLVQPTFLVDVVEATGKFSGDLSTAAEAIKPFFDEVYDKAGIDRRRG